MTTDTLHEKILNEFLNSDIKIKSLEKLNDYISYCLGNIQKESVKGKTSLHHILPKAKDCFPQYKDLKNNKWNGAHLFHSEHYYAHWLLSEAIDSSSQLFAFCAMHNQDIKIGRISKSDLISEIKIQKKMEERIKKYTESMQEIEENGKTKAQNRAKNAAIFMSEKSDNGKTIREIATTKSIQTRLDRYGQIGGLNNEKRRKTLEEIDVNGKSKKQNMLDKQHQTKLENNTYKIIGEKTKQTRLKKDKSGLNSYEKLSKKMTLTYNVMKGDKIIEEICKGKNNPLGNTDRAKKILTTKGESHLIGLYLIQI